MDNVIQLFVLIILFELIIKKKIRCIATADFKYI